MLWLARIQVFLSSRICRKSASGIKQLQPWRERGFWAGQNDLTGAPSAPAGAVPHGISSCYPLSHGLRLPVLGSGTTISVS